MAKRKKILGREDGHEKLAAESDPGGGDAEKGLADLATDDLSDSFGGMLSFSDEISGEKSEYMLPRDASSNSLPFELEGKSPRDGGQRIRFEIESTQIVKEGRSKYVAYSIVVLQCRNLDDLPTVIEKRYSDFDKLNMALKKRYPQLMQDISFPRKMLVGNFKPETIAQRSRAFEQYLTHVNYIDILRISSEFSDFFYGKELLMGYANIQNGQYLEAVVHLQKAVPLQRKLLGDTNDEVIATVCGLVACYRALERDKQAQALSALALRNIGNNDSNKYLVPLLHLCIRLCWKLGKDKKALEVKLQQLRSQGVNVDSNCSLLELVVNRFHKCQP